MNRFALVLAAAAIAAPAAAQTPRTDPRLEPAFGATIVSTYPDGRTGRLYLERNGAWRGTGRSGRPSSGVWRVDRNRICLRQRRPVAVPFSHCTAIVEGGVGTRWSGKAPTGENIQIQLVAGR